MPFTKPKASQIDFDVTNITDPLIRLNSNESGSADKDVGIVIERGSDTNAALLYDESADEFVVVNTSEDGTTSGNVSISSYADLQVAQIKASSGTMTGAIAMGTNKITGMGDPTANQDAATKAYVDSTVAGFGSLSNVVEDTSPELGGNLDLSTFDIVTSSNRDLDLVPNGTGDINLYGNVEIRSPAAYMWRALDSFVEYWGQNFEVRLTHIHNTGLRMTNTGGSITSLSFVDANEAVGSNGSNLLLTSGGNTVTVPTTAGTVSLIDATETLTNKTLTTPTLTTPVANAGIQLKNGSTSAGFLEFFEDSDNGTNKVTLIGPSSTADVTLTLPSATDTLVGKATTDTLTNKTLTNPTINAFSGTGNGSITGTLSIDNTTTSDSLNITTTEDSSSAGPVITLKRNSSSPADADYLGQIKFNGENDADQEVVYAKITGKIQDASDGTEDGLIEFANKKAGSNVITARLRSDSLQLLNSTGLTVAGDTTLTGNLELNAQADLQFYDSDSSNYVGFQAPSTISSNVLWTLPNTDGTDGQIIQTDGAGTLSWTDNSGGGGSGSSFPNSTFTTCPASDGSDFDLSFNVAQTSQETPFEASGTDAFGVNLGSVYSLMDPVGQTLGPFDMGALT